MMILDMHCHTTKAGPHSSLHPEEAISEGKRIGLNAICVVEHEWSWEIQDALRLSQRHGFPVFRGIEVGTDLGHVAVFGLGKYVSGIHKLSALRQIADEAGAFLIALHPFRRVFDPLNGGKPATPPTLEQAANWPLFQYVDEIEVLNGASSDAENGLALEVCRRLGFKGTAGSDAHSTHGLGCYTTVFEKALESEEDLINELRAGRFRPASGLITGALTFHGGNGTGQDLVNPPAEVEGGRRG